MLVEAISCDGHTRRRRYDVIDARRIKHRTSGLTALRMRNFRRHGPIIAIALGPSAEGRPGGTEKQGTHYSPLSLPRERIVWRIGSNALASDRIRSLLWA